MKVTTTPDDNPNAVVKKPCCKSKNISLVRAAFLFYYNVWGIETSSLFPHLREGTELERWKSNQPIEMKHAAGEKRGKFCVHASQDQNYLSDRQRKRHEICKYPWESLHVGMHSQRTNEYRTRAKFPKTQLAWWQRQWQRQWRLKSMMWLVEWGKIIMLHVRRALQFNSLM